MSVRVYKLGGPALEDPALLPALADELRRRSEPVALVHGGGRHIERMLRALGIESRFIGGRRETSPAAMEVVEMVLSGVVNKSLAAGLSRFGLPAVGISGRDGHLLTAETEPELGRVGRAVRVEPAVIQALWRAGLVPVISPVAEGPGGLSLNVNADEAALAIALALQAESLVFLSDVDGVRAEDRLYEALTVVEAETLTRQGVIAGGMALKVRAALEARAAGIPEVVVAGKGRLLGGFPGTRLLASRAEARA